MDFTPSEAAAEVAALAADIGASLSTPERCAELEATEAPLDRRLWRALGEAGLLGLAAPEAQGPGTEALGTEETAAVTSALGRQLARVPYGPHALAAIPALARFGSAALIDQLIPPASIGDLVLSAAFEDEAGHARLRADRSVTGTKVNVPYAEAADALLVDVLGPDGPVVAVVRTAVAGVTITPTPSTGLTPVYRVEFDDVLLGEEDLLTGGSGTVDRVRALLRLAVAADQAGVLDAALAATAAYAREREQFGRPIGSFQAVAQRLADGYIDVQAAALTTAQAAWLLSDAAGADQRQIVEAAATAKFWADEAGHRVAHTAVHVHGGVGLDTSHPLHRYFLRAKQNEFTLGSAPAVLEELGALISPAE
ncbi:putative acyl-CoA dehydrogenase [Gordonia hirsuta DSM 44140 = NBRC 16056]|uniref:Putative acyl-CoA dehydrogenase n=1 Tax=Gordonia hirsuta DSM 44140 = NBRC 16056 TaxID=1121927 RepID=L7LCX2_9ACTN|nr:acyl-CoA dehydrogenase family protein [Gordonia hirsuta]GAC57893.1 putative acyl-CoA dehydrogenase [Gordonia hirsuta DSM 44140 = NBRC 16056]